MSDNSQEMQSYIDIQFEWLKRELENIRSAIEKVSVSTVSLGEFNKEINRCNARVEEVERAIRALERQSARHEARLKMIASLGGGAMGLLIMLGGAWLKMLLGL